MKPIDALALLILICILYTIASPSIWNAAYDAGFSDAFYVKQKYFEKV